MKWSREEETRAGPLTVAYKVEVPGKPLGQLGCNYKNQINGGIEADTERFQQLRMQETKIDFKAMKIQ